MYYNTQFRLVRLRETLFKPLHSIDSIKLRQARSSNMNSILSSVVCFEKLVYMGFQIASRLAYIIYSHSHGQQNNVMWHLAMQHHVGIDKDVMIFSARDYDTLDSNSHAQ